MGLSEAQVERYSRQLLLPEIGGAGQQKLVAAKVFLVGAGGLGSPAAFYLAAAGVGTLAIADGDAVELHNLQRQILHRTSDVGTPKVRSAQRTLAALNPDTRVIPIAERLTSANALDQLRDYDIVLDGSDNFPTRYLINDACVLLQKPLVHGGIVRFDGQVFTILPGQGPCYRCLFAEPPSTGVVPGCQEAGILGAVAGVIGALQANEAIKYLVGQGELLVGRLVVFNALTSRFREVQIRRDPQCPVCGEAPTIRRLIDYEQCCGAGIPAAQPT